MQGPGELCRVAAVLRQVCVDLCEEVQVRPIRAVRRTFARQLFVLLCYDVRRKSVTKETR